MLDCGHYAISGEKRVRVREPTTRGSIIDDAHLQGNIIDLPTREQSGRPQILGCGSFEAARRLISHGTARVVVLDFASDSEPGGGWRGSQQGTQEESLCRSSSLGRALERLPYPLSTYGVAHIPEVVVFRDADGTFLDEPFTVGVIAAALRDVGGDGEPDAKQRLHLERKVLSVLATAARAGYDGLVLGDWGCGAFGNPPELVARAFATALSGRFLRSFGKVAFAILREAVQDSFHRELASLGAERVARGGVGALVRHSATEPARSAPDGPVPVPAPVLRWLSDAYGAGASKYPVATLEEWAEHGRAAAEAARHRDYSVARAHFERSVELRPDWKKGRECLERARKMESRALPTGEQPKPAVTGTPAEQEGRDDIPDAHGKRGSCEPFKTLVKGVKLLPHEHELVKAGQLRDVTHAGSSAVWLSGESTTLPDRDGAAQTTVYRPMGDPEFAHLRAQGTLPATQPYQTIVEGAAGREYAERYLRGSKWVDSSPTTVVEFVCPLALVSRLFAMQCKPEDGCLSHGLGDKGGKGLPLFNDSLQSGSTTFRAVLVKRGAPCVAAVGTRGRSTRSRRSAITS